MKTTREIEMSELRNWLDNEEEINEEYNALGKALEELDNIYHSDNEDDAEEWLTSRELIVRGYKVLSRNGIRKTSIDTLLEEYKEELRQQIITMNLYNELYGFSSEEIVSEELEILDNGVQTYASGNITTEYRKGDRAIRIIDTYEKSLTNEEVEKFETMTEKEKIEYVLENGEYML